jgi:hypothetical protein
MSGAQVIGGRWQSVSMVMKKKPSSLMALYGMAPPPGKFGNGLFFLDLRFYATFHLLLLSRYSGQHAIPSRHKTEYHG